MVTGSGPSEFLIRAIGPALKRMGVSGVLERPVLTVRGQGAKLPLGESRGNHTPNVDNLLQKAADKVGAFVAPSEGRDAGVFLSLKPGVYSATVHGEAGSTGSALFEIYQLSD